MIRLGEIQTLKIIKEVEFGLYLAAENPLSPDERVLLPIKQKPPNAKLGDSVEVFIYRDSADRLIATTKIPALTLGQVARLRVVQTDKIGAFLDWGLEKDLFLPFREQTRKLNVNDQINAALYIDKSDRLSATMKIYPYLKTNSPYIPNATVTGEIYELSRNFGAFVAVDNKYSALIPRKEIYRDLKVGDIVTARITAVKPDGKLDLAIRPKAYQKIGDEAQKILAVITGDYNGNLILFFKNGKTAKIPLDVYKTKLNRKKLTGAFSVASPAVGIFHTPEGEDCEFLLLSSDNKALIVNSKIIPLKTTRTTIGVDTISLPKGRELASVVKNPSALYQNTEQFKKTKIPARGGVFTPIDIEKDQISMDSIIDDVDN